MFSPPSTLRLTNILQPPKNRASTDSNKVIHLENRAHHHNQGNKMNLLKTQREALLAPLQAVTGIIERRHTLPILSNVLISSSGSRVEFLATDLEVQITSRADLEGT